MNSITNLTPQQLRQAAKLQDKIVSLRKELGRILGVTTTTREVAAPKRKMSAAARAKIAAAQKARWAKQRGPKKKTAKSSRNVSDAARKRLSQLAKARWAKVKAAGRKKL